VAQVLLRYLTHRLTIDSSLADGLIRLAQPQLHSKDDLARRGLAVWHLVHDPLYCCAALADLLRPLLCPCGANRASLSQCLCDSWRRSEEPPNITTIAIGSSTTTTTGLSLVFTSTALSSKPCPSHSQLNVVIDNGLTHSSSVRRRRSLECICRASDV